MTACEQLSLLPETMQQIIHGDCLTEMAKMAPNSVDFIVTDPPYGLHFMGKHWDGRIPAIEIWAEALRICKPGAMLAAFGGSRTHHHLMCAIEGGGWEIRDCIFWIYGSGFTKSHNFGRQMDEAWKGYGTALKPAYEPIIIAMKPLDGTFRENAEKWGVGGINIDESRIKTEDNTGSPRGPHRNCYEGGWGQMTSESHPQGRWPANVIFDEEAAMALDEMSGVSTSRPDKRTGQRSGKGGVSCYSGGWSDSPNFLNDSGGASRFFYCAKASSKERGEGNGHPTVKPIALMKYIIKLLAPPGNPTLLDPFCGSGSTLLAAKELGINAIGIEKEAEYCEIAKARLA